MLADKKVSSTSKNMWCKMDGVGGEGSLKKCRPKSIVSSELCELVTFSTDCSVLCTLEMQSPDWTPIRCQGGRWGVGCVLYIYILGIVDKT